MNLRFSRLLLTVAVVLAAASGLTGCSQRYIITTTSGAKVITATKPKLVQSRYVYKDGSGRTNELSTLRVRSVEPYSKEALGSPMKVPELR
jgi:hypothetical protein